MGRSAISCGLFLDDLFDHGGDRVSAMLLVGEGLEPAVGGRVNVFVGARAIERTAQETRILCRIKAKRITLDAIDR
jgi:hypothetical protein